MASIEQLQLQLERLYRHYDISVHTNDKVALLDLSHSLRIWTEFKGNIDPRIFPLIDKPLFKTASPLKSLKKIAGKSSYISIYFPDGVFTYANNGHIVSGPPSDKFSVSVSIKPEKEKNRMWVGHLVIIEKIIDEEYSKSHVLSKSNIIKVKYDYWLGSEAIRIYNSESGELITISREMIIKRVANILDGSHPSTAEEVEYKNRFDKHINKMMEYYCGGLPIPYFTLVKIAHDILSTMTKILNVKSYDIN